MKVTIRTFIEHKGNPRGPGHAKAKLIYIDHKGTRHEREVTAAVENDTKNALSLMVVTAALKMLTKPCEVDLFLDNGYIIYCIKNGWLEDWKNRGWKRVTGKDPANVILWKNLYIALGLHKIRFKEEKNGRIKNY